MYKLPEFIIEEVFDLYNKSSVKQTVGWGLINSKIPQSWVLSQGEGIKILVIDTGLPIHSDLDETTLTKNINEKVFIQKNDLSKNFVAGEAIEDLNGHQTHCTGIICARNNSEGMIGVAPKSETICAKVLNKDGRGSSQALAEALEYALEIKPDIISLSLGSSQSDPRVHLAIKNLYKENIPVICAAGNSGDMGVNFPAAYPETISVAAYDSSGKVARFSSKGKQ